MSTTTASAIAPNTAFSGSVPTNYDAYLGPLFFEPFAVQMGKRIAKLRPTSILEIACGTGRLTRYLQVATAPDAMIMATDINPAMLEIARRNVPAHSVKWNTVDSHELPFGPRVFDAVASQFGVMYFADRPKAFLEMNRVLLSGGTLFLSAWDAMRFNPVAHLTDDLLGAHFPEDTPPFYKIPFSYVDESLIRSELTAAGFSDIRFETLRLEGTSDSPQSAAKGLLEGTPVVGDILARDPDALPVLREQLEHDLAALYGNGEIVVPLQARFITATKA